ncbi:MAG: hypothetical protein LBJ71_01000 [Holosporaceae bacterium]|nr:hypothetical protein [Holosporaceae bacterium]
MFTSVEKPFAFLFSCVLSFNSCQALDEHLISPEFSNNESSPVSSESMASFAFSDEVIQIVSNPCYPDFSYNESFPISNGSIVSFASAEATGDIIRAMSALNKIKNPLGLTHSGIAFFENPHTVWDIIYSHTRWEKNGESDWSIEKKAGQAMLDEMQAYFKNEWKVYDDSSKKHLFLLEANGTVEQAKNLIYPHVQIHPFFNSLKNYDGNVYVRPFLMPIPLNFTKVFVEEYVGRSYEALETFSELVKAVNNRNKKENTEKVFCSELAALFYRSTIQAFPLSPLLSKEKVLEKFSNVSNIIPEQFCFSIGKDDVLQGIAGRDISLKYVHDFKEITCSCLPFFI